jgi:hypothetical protein
MTVTQAESDQPALGPDGQLLDASKITWHHDPDDPHPIQSTSGVQEGGVFHISHFSDNSFSCQVKWVNARAQSVPPLAHDLQRLSLLRSSMRMGWLVAALFYPEMRKRLLNESDPPLTIPFKLIRIWKIKLSLYRFLRAEAMTTHQTQTGMRLKSQMKRYS